MGLLYPAAAQGCGERGHARAFAGTRVRHRHSGPGEGIGQR
jgi:hypothetical protein